MQNVAVRIPTARIGHVIGKSGSGLREIREKTGCNVQVQKQVDVPDMFRRVDLTGKPEELASGLGLVLSIGFVTDQRLKLLILVPSVSLLASRLKENLKKCNDTCQVHASVESASTQEKEVTILGELNDIVLALRILFGVGADVQLSAGQQHFYVPARHVGAMVGAGGANLKKIAAETGCKISMMPPKNTSDRWIVIVGKEEAAAVAQKLLREQLVDAARSAGMELSEAGYRAERAATVQLNERTKVVKYNARASETASLPTALTPEKLSHHCLEAGDAFPPLPKSTSNNSSNKFIAPTGSSPTSRCTDEEFEQPLTNQMSTAPLPKAECSGGEMHVANHVGPETSREVAVLRMILDRAPPDATIKDLLAVDANISNFTLDSLRLAVLESSCRSALSETTLSHTCNTQDATPSPLGAPMSGWCRFIDDASGRKWWWHPSERHFFEDEDEWQVFHHGGRRWWWHQESGEWFFEPT